MEKRKRPLFITAGGIAFLGILLIFFSLWFYGRLTGKALWGSLFQAKQSKAVYTTLERVDDLALLECAVYRIRVVYPYDFTELSENLPILIGRYDFCVISVEITAGYDLGSLLTLSPEKDILTLEDDEILLHLGKPEITSFKVADQVIMEKGFPDMAVTPEEWRIIVDAVSPLIEQMAMDHGIMEEAEKYGREFFNHLLEGAGYEKIKFMP